MVFDRRFRLLIRLRLSRTVLRLFYTNAIKSASAAALSYLAQE